jgi:uncharacterized protein YjiS (DUF1127 family)
MDQAIEGRTTTIRPIASSRPATGVLRRVARGCARWVEIRCRRAALADELYRLDARAMADMGLQRSDIPLVVQSYPDTVDLLRRMVRRVGLDFEALKKQPAVMRRLERACVTCGFRRDCRWWLQCHDGKNGYRAFCPNTEEFDSLRLQQRRLGAPLPAR